MKLHAASEEIWPNLIQNEEWWIQLASKQSKREKWNWIQTSLNEDWTEIKAWIEWPAKQNVN